MEQAKNVINLKNLNDIENSSLMNYEKEDNEMMIHEDRESSSNESSNCSSSKNASSNNETQLLTTAEVATDDPSHSKRLNSNDRTRKLSKSLKINYACICMYALFVGTDFAVIIPTLWDRLTIDFEATGVFMGIVLSSYSLSGVLSGIIMGKLSDDSVRTKLFLLISIVFGLSGHVLYFLGISKYVILLARVITGVSLGASTVLLAYVAKTTNESQRTSIISLVMASRQIGLMFAPAFNIFLRKSQFYLFNVTWLYVDRKSVPGLFMCVLWMVCFIVALAFFRDQPAMDITPTPNPGLADPTSLKELKLNSNIYKKEFVRIEIFILLGITFFTYFNQTSVETIVIPFTELMFGWNELQNSILFCVGGVIIILSYVIIRMLTRKLEDRVILLIGVVIILTGLVIACACLPFAKQLSAANIKIYLRKIKAEAAAKKYVKKEYAYLLDNEQSDDVDNNNRTMIDIKMLNATDDSSLVVYHDYALFPAFVVFVALDVLGLPAISICSASLFTKLVDNKVQGIGQGIQRGVLGVGTILGPLSAGPLIYKPIVLLAITLTFIFTILIFLIVFFRHFKLKKLPCTPSS